MFLVFKKYVLINYRLQFKQKSHLLNRAPTGSWSPGRGWGAGGVGRAGGSAAPWTGWWRGWTGPSRWTGRSGCGSATGSPRRWTCARTSPLLLASASAAEAASASASAARFRATRASVGSVYFSINRRNGKEKEGKKERNKETKKQTNKQRKQFSRWMSFYHKITRYARLVPTQLLQDFHTAKRAHHVGSEAYNETHVRPDFQESILVQYATNANVIEAYGVKNYIDRIEGRVEGQNGKKCQYDISASEQLVAQVIVVKCCVSSSKNNKWFDFFC